MAEDARQASLDWSPPGISDLDPYSQSDWSSRLVPSRAGCRRRKAGFSRLVTPRYIGLGSVLPIRLEFSFGPIACRLTGWPKSQTSSELGHSTGFPENGNRSAIYG